MVATNGQPRTSPTDDPCKRSYGYAPLRSHRERLVGSRKEEP